MCFIPPPSMPMSASVTDRIPLSQWKPHTGFETPPPTLPPQIRSPRSIEPPVLRDTATLQEEHCSKNGVPRDRAHGAGVPGYAGHIPRFFGSSRQRQPGTVCGSLARVDRWESQTKSRSKRRQTVGIASTTSRKREHRTRAVRETANTKQQTVHTHGGGAVRGYGGRHYYSFSQPTTPACCRLLCGYLNCGGWPRYGLIRDLTCLIRRWQVSLIADGQPQVWLERSMRREGWARVGTQSSSHSLVNSTKLASSFGNIH